MADSNAGLLIAALVAIVAVVGLVILFKGGGGAEGAPAFRLPMSSCPGDYWVYMHDAEAPTGYWYCSTTGDRVDKQPDKQVYLGNY